MLFTTEFDSYVHDKCVKEFAKRGDEEAILIAKEFGFIK
jgi:hypothetical protein